MPRIAWLALITLIALCAAGCGRIERISECRALVEAVNGGMDELEAIAAGKDTPEKFSKLANGYGKLADEVAGLPVASGVASAQVAEYVAQLRAAEKGSRTTSQALQAGMRTEGPRRELDRLSRKEKLSTQKLDAYCHAP
jgi:hypothetical protein